MLGRAAVRPVFPVLRNFPALDFYTGGMLILRAPSGASEPFAHAIELINRDLDGLLEGLDTHRQNEFWTDLRGYALKQSEDPASNTRLIASDHVNTAVREALEMADEKISTHLRALPNHEDRARIWQMLHQAAEQQIEDTKHPKARHGGGGQSA